MPRLPARAHAHYPMAPGNSPSRIAGFYQRHRNIVQQALRVPTFSLGSLSGTTQPGRNNKSTRACDKTVDDSTWLWKAEEKAEGIPAQRLLIFPLVNNLDDVKKFRPHGKLKIPAALPSPLIRATEKKCAPSPIVWCSRTLQTCSAPVEKAVWPRACW
jgi:hypothetical protein